MRRVSLALVVCGLAAFLLFSTVSVAPAEEANPFYVGVFGGYVIPEDLEVDADNESVDVDLDDSWAIGAKFGYIIPQVKWLAAELEYTYLADQDFDVSGVDGDYSAHNVMANLLFRYPGGKIHPYAGIGLGVSMATIEADGSAILGDDVIEGSIDEDDTAFALQLIAGINFEISENWSADLAYKYFYSEYEFENVDVDAASHLITVGLNYHFGGTKEQIAPPPPPPPAPEPVVEPDTDGDGVIDKLDQCPDTPAGVKVDEVGCPLDTDKDGVYDYLDKCPDTPIELKVDKDGCPIKVTINLNVLFDFNKSDLKPQYHEEIKRVADYMKAYPWEKATLEGHTDSKGADAYNEKLSQRRVDAIKNYLVEKFGISADRLTAVGYGESKPIATNDTEEGRQLNRRVQAVMETYIRK